MNGNALNAVLEPKLAAAKRLGYTADFLVKFLKPLRRLLTKFMEEIMLMDRGWLDKIVSTPYLLLCSH